MLPTNSFSISIGMMFAARIGEDEKFLELSLQIEQAGGGAFLICSHKPLKSLGEGCPREKSVSRSGSIPAASTSFLN